MNLMFTSGYLTSLKVSASKTKKDVSNFRSHKLHFLNNWCFNYSMLLSGKSSKKKY